MMMVDVVS